MSQYIVSGLFDIKKKDLIKYGKAAALASPVGAAAYFGSKLKSAGERQWRKLPKWAQLSILFVLKSIAVTMGSIYLSGFFLKEIKTFKNPETGEDVRAESWNRIRKVVDETGEKRGPEWKAKWNATCDEKINSGDPKYRIFENLKYDMGNENLKGPYIATDKGGKFVEPEYKIVAGIVG